jgi:hypothetical protein
MSEQLEATAADRGVDNVSAIRSLLARQHAADPRERARALALFAEMSLERASREHPGFGCVKALGMGPTGRELRRGVKQSPPRPQNGLVFGTAAGRPQNASNVRTRVVTKSVERANEKLAERGETPLPAVTPHGLRRSFASLLYTAARDHGEMGHTDPALALSIYAHAMRRDEGENDRLKALVEGADLAALVTSDHSAEAPNTTRVSHLAEPSHS